MGSEPHLPNIVHPSAPDEAQSPTAGRLPPAIHIDSPRR